MDVLLTEEQKEKLRKLDAEMATRKSNEEKREQTSKTTGIPVDIADMDVIRIGILLGLIKKRSADGTRQTGPSLLDMLLKTEDIELDTTNVPKHYKLSPEIVTEMAKIKHQQSHVEAQTSLFLQLVSTQIKESIEEIQQYIYFNVDTLSYENFVQTCKDTLEVIGDELKEAIEKIENPHTLWDALALQDGPGGPNTETPCEVRELMTIMKVVRISMLGPLNICEYRNVLKDQIRLFQSVKIPYNHIVNNLSLLERRLALLGCATPPPSSSHQFSEKDARRLLYELQFRAYTNSPELVPFNPHTFAQNVCTPVLLCAPIDAILNISLLGPYLNNSIGFLSNSTQDPQFLHFYVLDRILPNGIRLWVMDIDLVQFCESLMKELVFYLIKVFRVFYKTCFLSNRYIDQFDTPQRSNHSDVFQNLLTNITFLCRKQTFHQFIKTLVITKSYIIPTQYDFFNYIESPSGPMRRDSSGAGPSGPFFPSFDKSLYNSIMKQLFDP